MFRRVRMLWALSLALFVSILVHTADAASFVRVVEESGRWWFEGGHGQRFFSLGVNCVGGCFGHVEASPMEASRKQRILSFLTEHGFNTAASWSSPSVWGHFYVSDQIYLGFEEVRDDTFDDSLWKHRFEPHLREEVKPFLGKENFIGYFIDNEREWNAAHVFGLYLGLSRQSPGSQAFVAFLKSFYQGSIERLNDDWSSSYRDFGDIPGTSPVGGYSASMERGVLKAWRNQVARTHYARYVSFLRSLDPDHLVLGIRYRGIPDVELFKTLSAYFDVNSVNDYNRYGNLRPEYDALYRASLKPLMITEFSFSGFPEPGHKSMLYIDVYSQENRGIGYNKTVLGAARAPYMVGMHWFFWMDYPKQDEAKGGFLPDENVGLVTCDESKTYEELAGWIKKTNHEVHAAHQAAVLVTEPAPAPSERVLRQFTPKLDGNISEWPPETAMKPSVVTSLRDGACPNHTYFMAHDPDALTLAGDVNDVHIENPGEDWFWTGDYLFLHLSPEESLNSDACGDLTLFICPVGAGPDKSDPMVVRWHSHGSSMSIPAIITKDTKAGRLIVEAQIPWTSLEPFGRRDSCLWKMKLGYQNTHEICQAYWTGVVLFEVR